jgi:hypothetical protein
MPFKAVCDQTIDGAAESDEATIGRTATGWR